MTNVRIYQIKHDCLWLHATECVLAAQLLSFASESPPLAPAITAKWLPLNELQGIHTTYLARPTEAVPEPASMSVIALGIGALAAKARRRK